MRNNVVLMPVSPRFLKQRIEELKILEEIDITEGKGYSEIIRSTIELNEDLLMNIKKCYKVIKDEK